jgi:hypothetical protein
MVALKVAHSAAKKAAPMYTKRKVALKATRSATRYAAQKVIDQVIGLKAGQMVSLKTDRSSQGCVADQRRLLARLLRWLP